MNSRSVVSLGPKSLTPTSHPANSGRGRSSNPMTTFLRVTLFMVATDFTRNSRAEENSDFNRTVAPILVDHCLECHHRGKASGGLNLATAGDLRRGGDTGPALSADSAAKSLLMSRVEAGEMPPQDERHRRPRLTDDQKATLNRWISAGAHWPKNRELGLHEQTIRLQDGQNFWSFQPVKRPPIPQVSDRTDSNASIGTNPIDAFIEQKLKQAGLELGLPATPGQLLRRASLDLIGLPPSLDEQDQFLDNDFDKVNLKAYEELIDRMLAHHGYGERWARYWLDLVRYADSNGYERDGPKPSVWRYRDYVIKALNRDKPYNRFVIEQIAGDELSDRSQETVIATGFHALGAWQDEVDPLEAAQYRADELDDMLRTTSQTFLGMTIGCARCHNHKFDPLSMVDYYSLAAILSPLKRPNVGREDRDRPAGSLAELAAIQIRDQRISERNQILAQLLSMTEMEWLASGKSALPAEVIEAHQTPAASRSPAQSQLIQKHADQWSTEVNAAMTAERRQQAGDLEETIQKLRRETPDLPRAYFQYEEATTPPPTYLLLSGRASNPGPETPPAVPVVLAQNQPLFVPVSTGSSGRRLALAQWIVDPSNPLTARVIVNRVWQHHFGEGIVATPSDFGQIGARPTHPELLDWLADWFVRDANWSLKKLHKLIMTSRTYCTTSRPTARQLEVDPENRLLARFPIRRLDVEAIRDSILVVSGKLNPEMFGPAVYLPIDASVVEAHTDKEAAWKTSPEPAIYRRTIYAYIKRTLLVPMLEVMDLCDTTNSTEKRSITSIAPQALTLYNGDFVNSQAAFFADRLIREAGPDPSRQIDRAVRLALGRPATEKELQSLHRFLSEEVWQPAVEGRDDVKRLGLIQVCRVLFNLNEFVYIE